MQYPHGDIRNIPDLFLASLADIKAKQEGAEKNERLRIASKPECGNCAHWMIQSQCPRESSRTVSMSEPPCELFKESYSAKCWRERCEAALLPEDKTDGQ